MKKPSKPPSKKRLNTERIKRATLKAQNEATPFQNVVSLQIYRGDRVLARVQELKETLAIPFLTDFGDLILGGLSLIGDVNAKVDDEKFHVSQDIGNRLLHRWFTENFEKQLKESKKLRLVNNVNNVNNVNSVPDEAPTVVAPTVEEE